MDNDRIIGSKKIAGAVKPAVGRATRVYAHCHYGAAGLGGVLGPVAVIILVIWLVGGI